MIKKLSQTQMVFYKLYLEHKKDKFRFVPAWEFAGQGDMHVRELGMWCLMSYKCPTRLTDIYQDNPSLLDREEIEGQSGSKYFGYRLSLTADATAIKEQNLRDLYRKIKEWERLHPEMIITPSELSKNNA